MRKTLASILVGCSLIASCERETMPAKISGKRIDPSYTISEPHYMVTDNGPTLIGVINREIPENYVFIVTYNKGGKVMTKSISVTKEEFSQRDIGNSYIFKDWK